MCIVQSYTYVSSYILQDVKTQPYVSLTSFLGSLLKNWERENLVTFAKI